MVDVVIFNGLISILIQLAKKLYIGTLNKWKKT